MLISAYCGGGFGSKGAGAISMSIPALLAKKANAPVMMRITREDEYYIGRARTGVIGRARAAFRKDGRMLGLDLFIIADNGPYGPMGDHRSAGNAASLIYQPHRDALARDGGPDQHAAAHAAALARPDAGQRHRRTAADEGRRRSSASIRRQFAG